MELEELIEKITDVKKELIEFYDMLYDCEETIIDEKTWIGISKLKEEAYDCLVDIKDILLETQLSNY